MRAKKVERGGLQMNAVSMVQSINYASERLRQEGPIPVYQYLIELGAKFSEFGGPPDEYIDPVKAYEENPEDGMVELHFAGFKYGLSFCIELGQMYIFGAIDDDEESKNRLCAGTLLDLIEKIIPRFSFAFGYFDMEGYDDFTDEAVSATQLKKIYWANFFGEPYVKKYGKEFLLGAPGYKKAELADGTIEYILTEDLFTPPDLSLERKIQEYFAPKAKVEIFKPGPVFRLVIDKKPKS